MIGQMMELLMKAREHGGSLMLNTAIYKETGKKPTRSAPLLLLATNSISCLVVTIILVLCRDVSQHRRSLLQQQDCTCPCFQVPCEWLGTCPLHFSVISDVPYSNSIRNVLNDQILSMERDDVDFLIHLGDIKAGANESSCTRESLQVAERVLRESPVPVFILVGDNEYNDCANPQQAITIWRREFVRYDLQKVHDLHVEQLPGRPEVFLIRHKRVLLFGLNLVGGPVHNRTEWNVRHEEQRRWIQNVLIREQQEESNDDQIHAIVFMGHADPYKAHDDFFLPLLDFLRQAYSDTPLLYLCGDAHQWAHDKQNFMGLVNLERIRLTGGVNEPIVRITVDTVRGQLNPRDAFSVQRFL